MATLGVWIASALRSHTAVFSFGVGAMALIAALLARRCCDEFFGPRGAHKAAHVLIINVIAPLAAWGALRLAPQQPDTSKTPAKANTVLALRGVIVRASGRAASALRGAEREIAEAALPRLVCPLKSSLIADVKR